MPAHGGDFVEDSSSSGNNNSGESSTDSTFDPFSDYSEFEEGSEEEADINFFHNGRLFSVGLVGGYESFTDTLGVLYQPSFAYGVFISYFFDLKLALSVGYYSSTHNINLPVNTGGVNYLTGSAAISRFEFDFKYYLNTQNVTRGLAALNPYLIAGFADYYRTTTFNGTSGYVRDGAFGIQGGLGLEIPMMHNKSYFGIQASYDYIAFPDKGTQITYNGNSLGIVPQGDALDFLGILGVNF